MKGMDPKTTAEIDQAAMGLKTLAPMVSGLYAGLRDGNKARLDAAMIVACWILVNVEHAREQGEAR